jgi:hypothetical protein
MLDALEAERRGFGDRDRLSGETGFLCETSGAPLSELKTDPPRHVDELHRE